MSGWLFLRNQSNTPQNGAVVVRLFFMSIMVARDHHIGITAIGDGKKIISSIRIFLEEGGAKTQHGSVTIFRMGCSAIRPLGRVCNILNEFKVLEFCCFLILF